MGDSNVGKNFSLRLISLVVTACKKLLFQELQVGPTLTPADHKRLTFVLQKRP